MPPVWAATMALQGIRYQGDCLLRELVSPADQLLRLFVIHQLVDS